MMTMTSVFFRPIKVSLLCLLFACALKAVPYFEHISRERIAMRSQKIASQLQRGRWTRRVVIGALGSGAAYVASRAFARRSSDSGVVVSSEEQQRVLAQVHVLVQEEIAERIRQGNAGASEKLLRRVGELLGVNIALGCVYAIWPVATRSVARIARSVQQWWSSAGRSDGACEAARNTLRLLAVSLRSYNSGDAVLANAHRNLVVQIHNSVIASIEEYLATLGEVGGDVGEPLIVSIERCTELLETLCDGVVREQGVPVGSSDVLRAVASCAEMLEQVGMLVTLRASVA